MEENKYAVIPFSARIIPIEKLNSEFTKVKIYVLAIGKNRNLIYIAKERVEASLHSLAFAPIVGHLIEKRDAQGALKGRYMGSHDWEIAADGDGFRIVDLTRPFGVVMPNSFNFETVNEYGTDVEYLTAQGVLWSGRYPEITDAIYDERVLFNQSMELTNIQSRVYEDDSNFTELLSWEYSALCLLGKSDDLSEHTEPCFISAQVIKDDEFMQMMAELKTQFAFLFEKTEGGGSVIMTNESNEALTCENAGVSEETALLNEQIEQLKVQLEESANELRELREFKVKFEAERRDAFTQKIYEEFADLESIAEFSAFMANIPENMSEEDIYEKCYAIRGRNTRVSFSAIPDKTRKQILPIAPREGAEAQVYRPYGGIDEKYLNK